MTRDEIEARYAALEQRTVEENEAARRPATPEARRQAMDRRIRGEAYDRGLESRYPHLGAWRRDELKDDTPEGRLVERVAGLLASFGARGSDAPETGDGRVGIAPPASAVTEPVDPTAARPSPSRPQTDMARLLELRARAGITDTSDLPRYLTPEQVRAAVVELEAGRGGGGSE